MSTTPACPCETVEHPRRIHNPPGRDLVDYRVGDFLTFRNALLQPRPHEHALAGWHPAAGTDLALQLVEWWAYLADILTFYNEQAIQEVLLRTAVFPEDVRRIVRLLGYRPRPGIAATGVVAALTSAVDPFVVPRGFAIEGETAPGAAPQIFELDDDVELGRVGRPLPASAHFGDAPGFSATAPKSGYVVRDGKGRLRNKVDAKENDKPDEPKKAGQVFPMFLEGVVSAVAPNDIVLFVKRDWAGHLFDPLGYAVAMVRSLDPIFDGAGRPTTRLMILPAQDLSPPFDQYRVLRPSQLAHLWLYHERYPGSTNPALLGVSAVLQVVQSIFDPLGIIHGGGPPDRPPEDPRVLAGVRVSPAPPPQGIARLESIARGISAGDPVLFEKRVGGGLLGLFDKLASGVSAAMLGPLRLFIMQLVKVNGYAEDIFYANAPQMDRIGQGPPVGPPSSSLLGAMKGAEGPIPIPHSRITFDPNPFLDVMSVGDLHLNTIVVHYGWQDIGKPVPPPMKPSVVEVKTETTPEVPPNVPVPALIKDRNGKGARGWLGIAVSTDGVELVPPLEALINLLPVSRGKTVTGEILGSGDPLRVRQEFALVLAPLTYLADTGPRSSNGYRSTLVIRVDGIEWREVASFFDQPPEARVFVTREDDEQRTHVRFGDGVHGARLPAGADNVVADYRHGSGAAIPVPGTLTTILRPRTGVETIVNPVPVGGGADPDPPAQIRRYAPRSVLTFGRAVSGDDYETVAAQTPGVRRARATWSWDPGMQRTVVKVFVGDDDAAVGAARAALLAFSDPNRPVMVALATQLIVDLTLRLVVDPAYELDAVQARVAATVLDPMRRPFGAEVIRIGDNIYDSQIHDACLAVPGVMAVHDLRFGTWTRVEVNAPPATVPPTTVPPLPPEPYMQKIQSMFGADYLPEDAYNPLGLALRLGVREEEVFDPFALAAHFAAQAGQPGGAEASGPQFEEHVQVESGARHSPGEGRVYQLLEERLHISAEAALHAL